MEELSAEILAGLPPAFIAGPTLMADWIVVWPLALPLIGAAVLLMGRSRPAWQAAFACAILLAMVLSEVLLVQRIATSGPVVMTMGRWLPPFGISFAADMLGASFALVAGIVSIVVLIYAQSEVQPRQTRYGYHSLLLLLLAGVNGAFLTGDVFNLYVWLEVMLIASFGLMIMGGRKVQLDGAVKYGFISLLGTTFFLIAVGLLYGLLGTLNMADIIRVAPEADPVALSGVAALFLLALGMKAAAFPVNAWLPASYHTPDPTVSALFGGLLTKVGVYAIIRILVELLPGSVAHEIATVEGPPFAPFQFSISLDLVIGLVAGATLILAPLGAMAETNLRRALGFLVIGGIGAMLAGVALADPAQGAYGGVLGAAMYALHSMLTITGLYLVGGLIERSTGTTDTRRMGGLYQFSSPLSILFICLVFAVSGLPPFLGFWPEFVLVQAGLSSGNFWLTAAILLNAFLTVIAGSRLWSHIFWRNGREGDQSEAPNPDLKPLMRRDRWWGLVPAATLALGIVLLGLWPTPLFIAGRIAAIGVIDPTAYVEAVAPVGAP